MHFYIAGPLYTPAERDYLQGIAIAIEDLGHSTFLPHRDAGLSDGKSEITRNFFDADLIGLEGSNVLLAILNGYDVDSGTSFELGYGYAKNKILLGLFEDTRLACGQMQMNLMIKNSVRLFSSQEELIEYCKMSLGKA